jgi:hypothetical protein
MRRQGIIIAGAVLAFLAAAVTGCSQLQSRTQAPKFTTPYQAVLLDNGQVYYGRLEGLGTSFPILREVYYVQTGVNPETKQQSNVLLKRGKEWHAPEFMVLNANHILLIEPVSPTSKVADLIAELKNR